MSKTPLYRKNEFVTKFQEIQQFLTPDLKYSAANNCLQATLSNPARPDERQARDAQDALLTLLCYVSTVSGVPAATVRYLVGFCDLSPESFAAVFANDAPDLPPARPSKHLILTAESASFPL